MKEEIRASREVLPRRGEHKNSTWRVPRAPGFESGSLVRVPATVPEHYHTGRCTFLGVDIVILVVLEKMLETGYLYLSGSFFLFAKAYNDNMHDLTTFDFEYFLKCWFTFILSGSLFRYSLFFEGDLDLSVNLSKHFSATDSHITSLFLNVIIRRKVLVKGDHLIIWSCSP